MLRLWPCLAALLTLGLPALTRAVGSVTFNVPSAAYPTIQSGVDAASIYNGRPVIVTVLVADGLYSGPGNRDIDFHGNNITVRSVSGATKTVIDCQGTDSNPHRGFFFHSGETATARIDGITVENGYSPSNPGSFNGGGICIEGSSPTIADCILKNNVAHEAGGGISALQGSPVVVNCVLSGNLAYQGGGIYLGYSNATVVNCTFSNNTVNTYYGPGASLEFSQPSITNCVFWDRLPSAPTNEIDTRNQTITTNISYSDIQGGFPGTSNIDLDPQFVNASAGDLHLKASSPCLGKGTPNGAPATDLDGNPRPNPPSMGAYDSGSGTPAPSFNSLHAYFANLHSHTNDSDGEPLASPDDAFAEAKSNGLDIMAVTDHAELLTPHAYSGGLGLPTWDILVPIDISTSNLDKWGSILNSASAINGTSNGSFLGLRGFEWSADGGQANSYDVFGLFPLPVVPSSTENIGHINVIGSSGYIAHHYVDPPQAQYQITTLDGLFKWVDSQVKTDPSMVCEFNHPNTYSGLPFNAVYNYPAEAFPAGIKQAFSLIELSGHSKYFGSFLEPEEVYNSTTNLAIWQAALKNDWRLAPALNEDNHTAEYGKEDDGRTGIWANSLSQSDVLQAIRARHVYATRDHRLILKFWLEDASGNTLGIMGDTLSARPSSIVPRVQTAGSGVSEIRLFAVTASSPIPLDNSTGSVLRYNINTDEFSPAVVPIRPPSDIICYYVRVDLGNGRLAFSAPIWLNPSVTSSHTHILWNNSDSRVMLWSVAQDGTFTLNGFGPYTDGAPQNLWHATAVATGPDGKSHLLWNNTDGRVMLWTVDDTGNFTLAGYGPYTDNAPQNLWSATAVATGPDGLSHILWGNTDYRAMLWGVDNAFNFSVAGYGPYTDNAPGNLWSATAISAGP